jgi:hypothetical protein
MSSTITTLGNVTIDFGEVGYGSYKTPFRVKLDAFSSRCSGSILTHCDVGDLEGFEKEVGDGWWLYRRVRSESGRRA